MQVSLGSLELWQLQAEAHWAIAQPSTALNPNTNLVKFMVSVMVLVALLWRLRLVIRVI
ncbi:MAG: hypothetical protein KME05_21830 [Gloeocapsa sp. UFS-A4-WI-NPMV-4B04]|nr:hypothetical protein [Gloeocapsa sp. UFS-A4-WI-NPMV-4B04]